MASVMVELPGEANPLTEGILLHVLKGASSSDQQQIQTATKQLQQWESQKGYYSLLQTIFIDQSLPYNVRYLAIIQLKNGIDKYWRKTATNAVSKEERGLIRSRLISSGLNVTDRRLMLQNALLIAKIVRFEYPVDWPEALTEVLNVIRQSSDAPEKHHQLAGSLLILLHIIKELATARLQSKRVSLQSAASEILHVLGRIYVNGVNLWTQLLSDGSLAMAQYPLELSLLSIKILRRLLVAGFEFPNRDKDVEQFWGIIRAQLGQILSLCSQAELNPHIRKLLEKHGMQFAKLHLDMAQTHPAGFVLLPGSLDLVKDYWGMIAKFGESYGATSPVTSAARIGADGDADEGEKPLAERLSLKGLLLIRACVKMVFNPGQTFKYRKPQEKEEKKLAVELVKAKLLTEDFVRQLMEIIVTRFFVMRASDLKEWEEEPDEWEKQEEAEGEGYEYSIRPCAEKLFLDVAINYKSLLVEPLLNVFRSVALPDNNNILFKDSVYTSVGLAAAILHEQLDFDAFISQTLVPEVQIEKPGYSVLRRRIAILLGQWISIKVSKPSRPLVYQIFQHLLDKSQPLNDQVVRVTAGRQFRHIADDWEFGADDFLPYAPEMLSRLMALIEEVELSETKMALLNTISVVVERLEHHITPFASRIVSLLPPLWDQSGEEHLMKQAILTILTRLIGAMKAESREYHSLVLPIIKTAVEPGSDTQLYLLDDALDLWATIIAQTLPENPNPDLLALSSYLLHILTLGSEAFRKALEITESYMLLSPTTVLSDDFRPQLLTILSGLLGELKPDASGCVTRVVELMIRAAEGLGGESAVKVCIGDMLSSGFLTRLIDGLKGAWSAHQTTGPNRRTDGVDGIIETDYLSILARIGLVSPQLLVEALTSASQEGEEAVMNWLLEEWFSHLENVGEPGRKKLMVLTLTKLLETGRPWILNKLQNLMTVWTDLVIELTDGNEDKTVDSLVYPPPAAPIDPLNNPEAPEDARRRQLLYSDPVHTTNLLESIREHLRQTVQGVGGEDVFQREWLINVDQDVVKGFVGLGII